MCIRKNEILKYGRTSGCQGCLAIAIDQSRTTANVGNECKVQCVTTQLELDVSKNPRGREGEMAPGLDVVMGRSISSIGAIVECGEVLAPRGTRRMAEDAEWPSFAQSRAVQSAHREWTVDTIAFGTARNGELLFAGVLNDCQMKPTMRLMGRTPYGTRRLDHNQGDTPKPEHRSSLGGQESRTTSTVSQNDVAATLSATPFLQVFRRFCGHPSSQFSRLKMCW